MRISHARIDSYGHLLSLLALQILALPLIAATGDGLRGEYFTNPYLSGTAALSEIDPVIDFNWGAGAPSPLPLDNFSVRWTGTVTAPTSGTYTLVTTTDDGARVWIDGKLIIDDWGPHSPADASGSVGLVANKPTSIAVEFHEATGGATARLSWIGPGISRQVIPQSCLSSSGNSTYCSGSGFLGTYYAGTNFEAKKLTRIDPAIAFDWNTGSPDPSLPVDKFSVRWQGEIVPRYSEPTTLWTKADDGIRLWVDEVLVIDDWKIGAARENSYVFNPVAGHRYAIRLEYFEATGSATASFDWESANEPRRPLTSQMLPLEGLLVTVPASSKVSPLFAEGTYAPGVKVNATANTTNAPVQVISDTRFGANLPLSPTAPTAVKFSGSGNVRTGSVTWQSTLMEGHLTSTLRVGDALLFEAAKAGHWRIDRDSGIERTDEAIAAGAKVPYRFTKAGFYEAIALDGGLVEVGRISITVVGASLPGPIACEVGFTRPMSATIQPDGAPITFTADASDLAVSNVVFDGGIADFSITPQRRGSPRVSARILGSAGPVITMREIDEFTVETNASRSIVVFGGLGTGMTDMTMRPYIPDLDFTLTTFAHRTTFRGGVTTYAFNTSGSDPDTAKPYMERQVDPATGETIGVAPFMLEVPADEDRYCIRTTAAQAAPVLATTSTAVAVAKAAALPDKISIMTTKTANGCSCTITIGPGLFVVPESTDEAEDNLSSAKPPALRQQKLQKWATRTVTFPVKETTCGAGRYKLTLIPKGPCGGGPDEGIGPFPILVDKGACEAGFGLPGVCPNQPDMRFGDDCDLVWPKVDCKVCEGKCTDLTLHTGILPQSADLMLTDCTSNQKPVVGTDFFTIVRLDLDGYSGSKPTDTKGADDNSTRDEMPAVPVETPNPGSTTKTVKGIPVQATLTVRNGVDVKIRILTHHPQRVRVSDKSSVDIPAGKITPDDMDSALPKVCIEKTLRAEGSGCTGRILFYLYGVGTSTKPRDSQIEVDVLEERTRCKAGSTDIESFTSWAVADTEMVTSYAADLVQTWNEVPVVDADAGNNPNDPQAFQYKFFVSGDDSGASGSQPACSFSAEPVGDAPAKGAVTEGSLSVKDDKAWLVGAASGPTPGKMYIQAFRFTDPGEYRIVATYRGRRFTSKSSPATTMAFSTSIITAGASPNMFLEGKAGDDRYGILPAKDFRPRAAAPHLHPPYSGDDILPAAPDRALTDTWSLKPKPTSTKAFTFAPKNGKSSSLEFKSNNADIATFTLNAALTKVSVATIEAGGDAQLTRNKTKGLFYMTGKAQISVKGADNKHDWALPGAVGQEWRVVNALNEPTIKTIDLAGHIDRFLFIVPALKIASPNGDPDGSPNATNKVVFDSGTRGKCVFTATADPLAGLSDKARGIVHPLCVWQIGSVGAVAATFNPATGNQVTVTYGGMPATFDLFGRKRLTLRLTGRADWQWYTDIETFFNETGLAASNKNQEPNWYFYWNQIAVSLGYGPHAPLSYNPAAHGARGEDGLTTSQIKGNGQALLIDIQMYDGSGKNGVTQYIGVLNHENGHVDSSKLAPPTGFGPGAIWTRTADSDLDLVPDAFERANAADGYTIDPSAAAVQRDGGLREAWEHRPFDPNTNAGLTTKYQTEVIGKDLQIQPLNWSDKGVNHGP